ncbi:hypothetical protein T439DRAFT_321208 [Meredithblackwellia eburnea MCA 4105]
MARTKQAGRSKPRRWRGGIGTPKPSNNSTSNDSSALSSRAPSPPAHQASTSAEPSAKWEEADEIKFDDFDDGGEYEESSRAPSAGEAEGNDKGRSKLTKQQRRKAKRREKMKGGQEERTKEKTAREQEAKAAAPVAQSGENVNKSVTNAQGRQPQYAVPFPGPAVSDQEEGEIDEFADLFMVDLTPSVIVSQVEDSGATTMQVAVEESREVATTTKSVAQGGKSALELEEEKMRNFAKDVIPSDASEDGLDNSDEDEDEDVDSEAGMAVDTTQFFQFTAKMAISENPEELEEAIKQRINDDSAAKVSGRYYKEVDLTRTCGLCGEQGHTSRECTHEQCFICGLVDGDHQARNCPVSLVCGSCGSRGHFARNCPTGKTSFHRGNRCSTCSSSLHVTNNCPSIWRLYDYSGVKPPNGKIKVIFACGNDGSTGKHFIDDCLLPRGHPMRLADASAFNADALNLPGRSGSVTSRQGGGATGPQSAAKRRGQPQRGSLLEQMAEDEDDDDDDWFASRKGGGGKKRHGDRDDRRESESSRRRLDVGHIKFDRDGRDYFRDNGSRGKGHREWDSDRYESDGGRRRYDSEGEKRRHNSDRDRRRYDSDSGRYDGRGGRSSRSDAILNYDSPHERQQQRSNSYSGSSSKASYTGRGTTSLQSRLAPPPPSGSRPKGPSYSGGYF